MGHGDDAHERSHRWTQALNLKGVKELPEYSRSVDDGLASGEDEHIISQGTCQCSNDWSKDYSCRSAQ